MSFSSLSMYSRIDCMCFVLFLDNKKKRKWLDTSGLFQKNKKQNKTITPIDAIYINPSHNLCQFSNIHKFNLFLAIQNIKVLRQKHYFEVNKSRKSSPSTVLSWALIQYKYDFKVLLLCSVFKISYWNQYICIVQEPPLFHSKPP